MKRLYLLLLSLLVVVVCTMPTYAANNNWTFDSGFNDMLNNNNLTVINAPNPAINASNKIQGNASVSFYGGSGGAGLQGSAIVIPSGRTISLSFYSKQHSVPAGHLQSLFSISNDATTQNLAVYTYNDTVTGGAETLGVSTSNASGHQRAWCANLTQAGLSVLLNTWTNVTIGMVGANTPDLIWNGVNVTFNQCWSVGSSFDNTGASLKMRVGVQGTLDAFLGEIDNVKFFDSNLTYAEKYALNTGGSATVSGGCPVGTGGTITNFTNSSGTYTVHTFTSNGTFSLPGTCRVDYLVVAGGGGGGGTLAGNGGAAGGGAGGLRSGNITLAAGTYAVTVGTGGEGGTGGAGNTVGGNGTFSNFSSIKASGGGGGAKASGGGFPGQSGGSGGGAYYASAPGAGNIGSYNPVEGKNGSVGCNGGDPYYGGGGGGSGTDAVTALCTTNTAGDGGNGTLKNITGTATYYAGGGAGGNAGVAGYRGGYGGLGGGGRGGNISATPTAGTANTGSGGGGGAGNNGGNASNYAGAAGGSGIVIISYIASDPVNVVTVSLSQRINASGWPSSVTFGNISGTLTFTYYNITALGFCVAYTGNGTGSNCTASGSGISTYFNVSNTTTVTGTATVTATTYQALINASAYQLYSNNTISTFNTTNIGFVNASGSLVYANNGSNNIKIDVNGNFSKNITCTVNAPLTTIACNATGIHDSFLTVGARSGSNSISTFALQVTNLTLGGLLYSSSTTNGSLVVPTVQGYYYYLFMNATNYSYANTSFLSNQSANLYNFSLGPGNAFELNFKNETSEQPLINVNISVQVITDTFAQNYTTANGSLVILGLTPDDYTIRYWIDPAVPRDYYATLNAGTYNNLTLYVVDAAISNIYLPIIVNENTAPVSNAIVKLLRYYISTNSYQVVEMEKTDTNGQAVLRVVPNVINYKLLVTINDDSMTTAPTKFTDSTNTYTINLQTNPLSAIFSVQGATQSFTYNNATLTYTFTWNDPTSVITQGCMNIQKFSSTGTQSTAQNTCSSGSTGSIIYTVTDTNNTRYIGNARVITTSDNTYTSGTITADYTTSSQSFGINGWIVAFFFFLALISLGIDIGTRGVIITGVLSILGMGAFGFIPYTWETIVGLMIIGVIILYKVRS